jgi:hypothetical protein
MENLYVWLLISAGAILGLAGLLLFASERKRGKQRPPFEEPRRNYQYPEVQELRDRVTLLSRRLEESQRRLEELQEAGARSANQYAAAEADLADARQQVDNVMTRNRALLDEVDSLSTKLTVSQKTVEDLLTLENDLSGAELDSQRLRAENQALQQEIAGIRSQLESRPDEIASPHQEPADHDSEPRAESLELQQRLDASAKAIEELQAEQHHWHGIKAENQRLQEEIESLRNDLQARLLEAERQSQESGEREARAQTEIAELKEQAESKSMEWEAVRQQLAGVESREAFFRNQQHDFEAQMAGLRRELAAEKERGRELELTRGHLTQMEEERRKLRGENRRLEEERTRWQERIARSEEYERQAGMLRQRLDELTKQALLIDSEDQHYKETVAVGDLAGSSWRRRSDYDASAAQNIASLSIESTPRPLDAPLPSEPYAAKGKKIGRRKRSVYQKWGLKIVPVTGVMATAAAVALGFLAPRSDEPSESKKPVVVSHNTVSGEPESQNETALESQKPAPAAPKGEPPKAKQTAKPSPRLRGAFEITRPTQVYSGPSEITLAIARIEPGTKINVIDSRDGWLEIRSKHGRPPGFIRQEAAVRINPERG